MKVYSARDNDGECSVWDARETRPIKDSALWTSRGGLSRIIALNTTHVTRLYGPGFHGVRKGQCKLVEVENG